MKTLILMALLVSSGSVAAADTLTSNGKVSFSYESTAPEMGGLVTLTGDVAEKLYNAMDLVPADYQDLGNSNYILTRTGISKDLVCSLTHANHKNTTFCMIGIGNTRTGLISN
jgi:hypothetical protein